MMLKRTITATLAPMLALLTLAGAAHAGRYHVYTCRTPAGESAPADGWSGTLAPGGAYDDYARNTCAEQGALVAALGDQTTHLANIDRATWSFEAPSFAQVVAETLWRAGDTAGGATANATYQFWMSGPTLPSVFDECIAALKCSGEGELGQPLSSSNRVDVPSGHIGAHLYVNVSCAGPSQPEPYECKAGSGDANNYAAAVYLFAADLTLEQSAGPSASGVAGELASAPTVSGTSDLLFNASDPGSGVYEAVFTVDGAVVQRTVLDENGGRCRNVGETGDGLPAFLYLQPCKQSLSADVSFDSTAVPNGTHHLVVSVIDAAGNSAPLLDRTVAVSNAGPGPAAAAPGPPNGTNASAQAALTAAWRGTRRVHLITGYGRRPVIEGRLTGSGGVPISGAQIDVSARPAYAGARTVPIGGPHTGKDGRFSFRLPRGVSSRILQIAYRAHLGDRLPVATRTLLLTVHAGIKLDISPRTTSVGGTIYFRGRLLGRPIPPGGKQLVLEARSPGGRWIEFDVIRTNSRGRFRASYRFRLAGPALYQFRVHSEAEADYPFASGNSNMVRVTEL